MKIIAVDPGYERVGIAIMEKGGDNPPSLRSYGETRENLVFSECFKTSAKLPHEERLGLISNEIEKIIKEHRPEVLSIEKLFFKTNAKTALKVAEARGVIISEATKLGLKVFEYTPLQIKIATTGYGKSDKNQIISMVPRLIKITKEIKHDDEYDAIATGLTFFACNRV